MPTLDAAEWCYGTLASFLAGLVTFGSIRIWNDRKNRLGVGLDQVESLQRALEEKARELEDANRQLALTRAMAVQSGKLAALGRMSAGIAHEIKNPLNFLINIIPEVRRDLDALSKVRALAIPAIQNAQVMERIDRIELEADLPHHLDEREYVFSRIQKALDNTIRIASGLTNFSRPADPEIRAPENVAAMIDSVIEMIPKSFRRDVRFFNTVSGDLYWTSNRNEVEQAVLALMNNAIDAMGRNGCLEIGSDRGVEPGGATISFRDSGPGIPEDILPNIFQPFFTTKPAGQGTGLGLAISLDLVEKNGGRLSVESESGKGATFRIQFMVEPASIRLHDVMNKYENTAQRIV